MPKCSGACNKRQGFFHLRHILMMGLFCIRIWVEIWVEFCLISWNSNCQIFSQIIGKKHWSRCLGTWGYRNGCGKKKIGEQQPDPKSSPSSFWDQTYERKNPAESTGFPSCSQMFHCRMAINSQQTLHVHPQILGTVVHPITNHS